MAVDLERAEITPDCRANRTDDGAWEEAVARLRQVYDAQRVRRPEATITLTIGRA